MVFLIWICVILLLHYRDVYISFIVGAFQVGHDAFEQAASGGAGDPFDDFFNGGSGVNDVCTQCPS